MNPFFAQYTGHFGSRTSESQSPMVAVTGSQRPYVYDLPYILSLPAGFEFRFRYFVDWVSAGVRAGFDATPRGVYPGRPLILVYHSQDTGRLLPLRRGEVIDLERRGPFYFLRFVVGEFAPVSRDVIEAAARDEARRRESAWLEEHGRRIVGVADADLSKPLPKGTHLSSCDDVSSLFTATRPGGVPEDSDGKWAAVAALLMAEPSLEAIPMFFLHGFVSRQGKLRATAEMQNSFSKGGRSGRGFELVSGERYRLRLIQWMGVTREMKAAGTVREEETHQRASRAKDEAEKVAQEASSPDRPNLATEAAALAEDVAGRAKLPEQRKEEAQKQLEREAAPASYRVVCQVDQDALRLEGQSDLIVGKYDVLEYTIKARIRGYSELTLGVEESGTEGVGLDGSFNKWHQPWPQLYSVRVPVRVRRNRVRFIVHVAFALAGLALFLAPDLEIWNTWFTPGRSALSQLVGLALLFASYGGVLSGYVNFAEQGRGLSRVSPAGP